MTLHVPLVPRQIDAANRIYGCMEQWKTADAALDLLHARLPGFSAEECLLKCVAVNSLYSTNVLAITRMARHVHRILSDQNACPTGTAPVASIAALPAGTGERSRHRTSFAAKFCHFFVSSEEFPIYDEALRLHLGRVPPASNGRDGYTIFYEQFSLLLTTSGVSCPTRDLDRYLWITGMYLRWLKERHKKSPRINAELLRLFQKPIAGIAAELDALLPATLDRAFKGEL